MLMLFRSLAILPVLALGFCAAAPTGAPMAPTTLTMSANDAAAGIFAGLPHADCVPGKEMRATPERFGVFPPYED